VNIIANVRDMTRLREADELKNTFISIISHELKTPVALIKGYAGTLRRDDARWDAATVRDSAGVIEEEADHLTELIDNLLDASRLQAGGIKLNIGDVALDQLARHMVEKYSVEAAQHPIELSFPKGFPTVPGDSTRLENVLSNLINNAIKYSPAGAPISLSGRTTPQEVIVSVADRGIGIPLDEQGRIFERFYRVDDQLSRQTQGSFRWTNKAASSSASTAWTINSRGRRRAAAWGSIWPKPSSTRIAAASGSRVRPVKARRSRLRCQENSLALESGP